MNITYMVGSRHEGYGETGMAHLLEHMVFKGTTHRGDIKVELRNHGAEYNGSTSFDRTNYFETLPADNEKQRDENLRYALEMEADRMISSRVSAVFRAKCEEQSITLIQMRGPPDALLPNIRRDRLSFS